MSSIRRAIVAESVAVVEAMKDSGISKLRDDKMKQLEESLKKVICWTLEKTAQGPVIVDCDAAVCSNSENLEVVEIEAMRWEIGLATSMGI
uniref:Uncharacterized protein n=1 Tax=Quercus lobata TaxID=97700 RepID=A0A7N2MKI1_QUELO